MKVLIRTKEILTVETDVNQTYCGDHTQVSNCYAVHLKLMLHVNYISVNEEVN